MTGRITVAVPDLGDFSDVEVIDVLVKTGDSIAVEAPLITLETDKATMDVPSTAAGRIVEVVSQEGRPCLEGFASRGHRGGRGCRDSPREARGAGAGRASRAIRREGGPGCGSGGRSRSACPTSGTSRTSKSSTSW